jgi:hypothetical protein
VGGRGGDGRDDRAVVVVNKLLRMMAVVGIVRLKLGVVMLLVLVVVMLVGIMLVQGMLGLLLCVDLGDGEWGVGHGVCGGRWVVVDRVEVIEGLLVGRKWGGCGGSSGCVGSGRGMGRGGAFVG